MSAFSEKDDESAPAKKSGWFSAMVSGVQNTASSIGSGVTAVTNSVGLTKATDSDTDEDELDSDLWSDEVLLTDDAIFVGNYFNNGSESASSSPRSSPVAKQGGGDDIIEAETWEKKQSFLTDVIRSHAEMNEDTCKIKAGSTMMHRRREAADYIDSEPEAHIWSDCASDNFSLRVGPKYDETRAKAPSGQSLYEPIGFDLYHSKERIDNIGGGIQLPEEWTNIETNHPDVPPVFIMVAQIPEVNLMSGMASFVVDKSDGPGLSYVMYFRIRESTVEAIKNDNMSPALKLFVDYCKEAPGPTALSDSKATFHGRTKIIPQVDNVEDLNLPGLITSYNSKPACIKKCININRNERNICCDVRMTNTISLPLYLFIHPPISNIANCTSFLLLLLL